LTQLGFFHHPLGLLAADDVPQSVAESSADFDPRKDPLETEVIREFNVDGGGIRHVRFLVGTFNGKPARMTPINGFSVYPGTRTATPGGRKNCPR